jgi:xylulokinase
VYWLGIDVGTEGRYGLLVDGKGKVRHAFTAPHEDMRMERPLWAEQRPENWWDAAQAAIRGVLAAIGVSGKDIRGIGLSGQMHGLVLLDASDRVIRPALIWCDQRSQAQVDAINALVGKATVLACIANPVLTGFTLPKLLWVRDNEPDAFARIRKILSSRTTSAKLNAESMPAMFRFVRQPCSMSCGGVGRTNAGTSGSGC